MPKKIESSLGHLRSPASPWKPQDASSPGDGPEFQPKQSQTLHVESSSLTRQASLYDPQPPYEELQQQSIADAGYNPPSAPQRVYHNDHGQLDQLLQAEGPLTFPRPISTQPKEYAASSTYDTGSSSGNRLYRDPSTPSVVKERGFQLCSILKFLGDSANVLDPPPPCFDRPVPPSIPDQDFPSMTVQSASYDVEDGFPRLLPACVLQPHPFFTHDIPEEAYNNRFLADLKLAGRLTVKDTLGLGLPLLAHPKMKAVPAKQLDAKHQAIGHYVGSWNTYFFRPRKMEVALLQGDQIINGTKGDSSSIQHRSAGSEERSDPPLGGEEKMDQDMPRLIQETREDPLNRRAERRACNAERRQKRCHKAHRRMPYTLVISPEKSTWRWTID